MSTPIGTVIHRPEGPLLKAWQLFAATLDRHMAARKAKAKQLGIDLNEG